MHTCTYTHVLNAVQQDLLQKLPGTSASDDLVAVAVAVAVAPLETSFNDVAAQQ